jgi:hypothetical protein
MISEIHVAVSNVCDVRNDYPGVIKNYGNHFKDTLTRSNLRFLSFDHFNDVISEIHVAIANVCDVRTGHFQRHQILRVGAGTQGTFSSQMLIRLRTQFR